MKNTILSYNRGEIQYTLGIDPKMFSKLVAGKMKYEHFEEYEAILLIVQHFLSALEFVDSFEFSYIDEDGFKHIITGNLKK